MKDLITSILLVIYVTFSTGATLHIHYCMGEFVKVSFANTNSGVCEKCGMANHNDNSNCCKDLSITAKILDSHYSASLDHALHNYIVDDPSYTYVVRSNIPLKNDEDSDSIFSSPGDHHLFLKLCNLRI